MLINLPKDVVVPALTGLLYFIAMVIDQNKLSTCEYGFIGHLYQNSTLFRKLKRLGVS
jgi:hypothetical protein